MRIRELLIVLVIGVILLSACTVPTAPLPPAEEKPSPETEVSIPSYFTTYTDEVGLFSISYPRDWELALSLIEGLEEYVREIITSIESDAPVEQVGVIFFVGLPTSTGYMPNVNIVVESIPGIEWTHNNMVEAEVRGLENFIQDYNELSRVTTTVGGREATIIEYKGTLPELGRGSCLVLLTLVGKTAWIVTCTAATEEFSKWEEEFNAIVRSLRILD